MLQLPEKDESFAIKDKTVKCFIEEQNILKKQTKYFLELYDHTTRSGVLNCPPSSTCIKNNHSVLQQEVEAKIRS